MKQNLVKVGWAVSNRACARAAIPAGWGWRKIQLRGGRGCEHDRAHTPVGFLVGASVGVVVVGAGVGASVGATVGASVGRAVGTAVGLVLGFSVVGSAVGALVGAVGATVGLSVHLLPPTRTARAMVRGS